MRSIEPAGSGGLVYTFGFAEETLLSPDLSRLAVLSETQQNLVERSPDINVESGPTGGPYELIASIPRGESTTLSGANSGAPGVPAFSRLFVASVDHALLPGRPTGSDESARDLYEVAEGRLRLVNARSDGSLLSACGAELGQGPNSEFRGSWNAVSADGSTVFFTSPDPSANRSEPGCEEPTQLYMRVNGGEPVQVSAPQGVSPLAILPVRYNGASVDGSRVFFTTETELTPDAVGVAGYKLFEYDTQRRPGQRLKLVAAGVHGQTGQGRFVVISEDGSTVYYLGGNEEDEKIWRFDTTTGRSTFVADTLRPMGEYEHSYATPDGRFFLFASGGVAGEPRGAGHNEMYRYDSADGSVMCVSCGPGSAPAAGEMKDASNNTGNVLATEDETPPFIPMSKDGRYVFFQTTAQLVRQDTNSTEPEGSTGAREPGRDVYEWEASGTGGCELPQGCTYLISSGEEVGKATLIGASSDGRDVFFTTASRMAPQDFDEFTDIYDARIGGGFALPVARPECGSCQGLGSPPPQFSVPATVTLAGARNPAPSSGPVPGASTGKPKPKRKQRCRRGYRRGRRGRCVRAVSRKAGSHR
jgi:hypothetical protein